MKFKRFQWTKLLRRCFALFLATVAIWLLSLTCDPRAACRKLGENAAFVSAILQAQLGPDTWSESSWNNLNRWQKLALSQSTLLRLDFPSAADPVPTPSGSMDTPTSQPEDQAEPVLPQTTTAPEDIQERTILAANSEGYLTAQGICLFNYTNTDLNLQAVNAAQVNLNLTEDGPQILIMHTHGSEAYTMDGSDIYQESDTSRTTDEHYNMIRVGDEMQRVLEKMGFRVVHDRTLYDYPQYNGSYTRSCTGVETWLREYPTIQVVLDVHRDALIGEDGTVYKPVIELNGEKVAQVLTIVGTDDLGQEHPYWMENLALAIRVQQNLDAQCPTLARPVTLRSSRFNQQLTRGSLLVEVGSHGNTLQEALRGASLYAEALGKALLSIDT